MDLGHSPRLAQPLAAARFAHVFDPATVPVNAGRRGPGVLRKADGTRGPAARNVRPASGRPERKDSASAVLELPGHHGSAREVAPVNNIAAEQVDTCPFGECSPYCAPDQDRHMKLGEPRVDPENIDGPTRLSLVYEADPDGGSGTYIYKIGDCYYSRSMMRQLMLDYLDHEARLPSAPDALPPLPVGVPVQRETLEN